MKRFVIMAAVLIAACGDDAADVSDREGLVDDVIFLAQTVQPDAVMEALFDGVVEVDQAGCVRLVSSEPATVVWPKDFSVAESAGQRVVRDASGRTIGRLGGNFRFGGGYVNELHSGIPLASADRQRAVASCPGNFWIVGEVP
jgi:hypothetical protein